MPDHLPALLSCHPPQHLCRYPEERDILEREGVTETNATINDY